MTYRVLTPFKRFENLLPIYGMLKCHLGVRWHPIFDDDLPFKVKFDQEWVVPAYCPPYHGPLWERWAHSLNWFIGLGMLEPNDRYLILNDDDAYEPGFFRKLDEHKGDVVICSMKRGHRTPNVDDPARAHPPTDLIAAPENMELCGVGIEQLVITGELLSHFRLPMDFYADGLLIKEVVKTCLVRYAPEAFVWFNWFEPGRWDK